MLSLAFLVLVSGQILFNPFLNTIQTRQTQSLTTLQTTLPSITTQTTIQPTPPTTEKLTITTANEIQRSTTEFAPTTTSTLPTLPAETAEHEAAVTSSETGVSAGLIIAIILGVSFFFLLLGIIILRKRPSAPFSARLNQPVSFGPPRYPQQTQFLVTEPYQPIQKSPPITPVPPMVPAPSDNFVFFKNPSVEKPFPNTK